MPRPISRLFLMLACTSVLVTPACTSLRPGGPTRVSAAAPALSPGAAGHIVLGPYVQPASTDLAAAMNVVWWSDAPGTGLLEWTSSDRKAGGKARSVQLPYAGWVRHVARIDRPQGVDSILALVSVTVESKRYSGPVTAIPLAPRPDQPLRFAALGDTGAGTDSQRNVVAQVARQDVDLLLITGDDVYGQGDWEEYKRRFFPYYGKLMATVPILPALGNHDVGNPEHMGQPFRMAWTPPANWQPPASAPPYSVFRARSNKSTGPLPVGQASGRNYSVDAGRCHFLCLDSTADRKTIETQIVPWARRDLADAKQRGSVWLIAFWHHPPYTRGAYRDNRLQWGDIRDLYVPMLRQAGARIVLLGHDHNYQHMRKDGIDYIITGAGGAKLYPVHPEYDGNDQPPDLAYNDKVHSFTLFDQSADGKTLKVRQIDENSKELDAFTLTASEGETHGSQQPGGPARR